MYNCPTFFLFWKCLDDKIVCRTGQICIVQSPTINFIFFTISNLNYTVFVSLVLMIMEGSWFQAIIARGKKDNL